MVNIIKIKKLLLSLDNESSEVMIETWSGKVTGVLSKHRFLLLLVRFKKVVVLFKNSIQSGTDSVTMLTA